jgi:EmrB/QacA subfamily drug resistance transporter
MARLTAENRHWWILATMTGAVSMVLIDETVVSVALPAIQRDLHMSQTGLQWVVNAYILALASCAAAGGRLGDLLGQARIFRLGALMFVAASAGCGLAQSQAWIIAGRAVQGLGAAAMIPATGTIVINAFHVRERGRAMGIYAGSSMVSLALGPLLGGLLTQLISWRAVFWVNLPLGSSMLALSAVTLPADEPERGASMDWRGALTLVPGLLMIVLALMQSQQWGWTSTATITLLAAGAALIIAFALVEPRRRSPLVQLTLFRNRNFAVDGAVLGLVQFALTGLTVFAAIYVQELLGFGPIAAGASLLPVMLPVLLFSPLAGRIYDRAGPRTLVTAGAVLLGAGLLWAATLLGTLSYAWLLPGYMSMGIGIALVTTPTYTDAMNTAPAAQRGQAQGVTMTLRQVGGTVGLAIMGTVVATVQHDRLADFARRAGASVADRARVTAAIAAAHGDPALLGRLPQGTLIALRDSLLSGISSALYIGGGVVLAGAAVAWALLRRMPAADAPAAWVPVTLGCAPDGQGSGLWRAWPSCRRGSHEVTFAESSPDTSKVRIGREKPRNDSSPTSRLTTNSSAAAWTRWVTRICQGAASAHRRAAR